METIQTTIQYYSTFFEQGKTEDFHLAIALTCCLSGLLLLRRSSLWNIFLRPPPVSRKQLPKRPTLQLLFKPDDASNRSYNSNNNNNINKSSGGNESASCSSKDFKTESFLPDSFAPLLSSSQMEILGNKLCADLIHAFDVKCNAVIRPGRHEIPLNRDRSRPQFIVIGRCNAATADSNISNSNSHHHHHNGGNTKLEEEGTKVNISATIGSDGFTLEQDFDARRTAESRSKSIVKSAFVTFDPPLALDNVVPTLIHFPNLFEDNYNSNSAFNNMRKRRQGVHWILSCLLFLASLLEKLLWSFESICKIHLSKVKIAPTFKHSTWRLQLSFTGHAILFRCIPIPFISVTLPTMILPAPHALLERIMTTQPLASARLKHENIARDAIALAFVESIASWNLVQCRALVTPPALGVDITLPGGVAVAVEAMLGRDVGGLNNIYHNHNQNHPGKNGNNHNNSVNNAMNGAGAGAGAGAVGNESPSVFSGNASLSSMGADYSEGYNNNNNNNAAGHHQHHYHTKSNISSSSFQGFPYNNIQNGSRGGVMNNGRNFKNHASVGIERGNMNISNPSATPPTATTARTANANTNHNSSNHNPNNKPYDANIATPWTIEIVARGTIEEDQVCMQLYKFAARNQNNTDDVDVNVNVNVDQDGTSGFLVSGNWQIFKADHNHNLDALALASDKDAVSISTRNSSVRSMVQNIERQMNSDNSTTTTTTTTTPSELHVPASKTQRRKRSSSASMNMNNGAIASSAAANNELLPSVMTILYLQHSNDPSTSTTTVAQKRRLEQALQYDYAFDVDDHSHIDAVSISIGANHSMLQGGTMITTVLESIYAHGATSAREGAILDVIGRKRKRDILRHLPVVDFTVGVRNAYIPKQSCSFSDDGLTRYLPEVKGGRMMVRIIGDGTSDYSSMNSVSNESGDYSTTRQLLDGIKLIADVGVSSFVVHAESQIHEFPELDIFEGVQLRSFLSGSVGCRIQAHLRPDITHQTTATVVATTTNSHYNNNPNNRNCRDRGSPITITGPNVLNPLEAYEIDFTGSTCTLKIKESNIALGHRRIIIPSETGLYLKVLESVVDMSMDKGNTLCEFSWDFQGSSPILQVTNVGHSPASAAHENKRQVSLLIPQMRQGRMNFHVSSVGGIRFHQAATIRENKEGLYDWKFFNALVSVDGDDGETAASRLMDVIHDKRTMHKLLQIAKLVSADLGRILEYALTQIWRAKEILDQEGINEPGHAIPCHKTARLLSLFLCGDLSQINVIVPILQRVTSGGGLDVVKTKELLQQHLQLYEDWAPEMDRLVRLVAVMVGPMVAPAPYEENGEDALPLCELEEHAARFRGILTAKEMYEVLHDPSLASSATMNQVALDIAFSNYIALVAPYLSIRQVEYVLQARSSRDWQPEDLRRLRYVYSVKKKVLDISESYGGLSFLPQSFFVSIFVGEATRASLQRTAAACPFSATATGRRSNNKNHRQLSPTLSTLRRRQTHSLYLQSPPGRSDSEDDLQPIFLSPAFRRASGANIVDLAAHPATNNNDVDFDSSMDGFVEPYELGESLLGPQDVAILLQAGLASAHKGSTVVQLNQRMLLDLIASQPDNFAVAVLAEIGTPGGHGSPRSLASALMSLLELDQSSFAPQHRIDMHALLESWLAGYKLPRRGDYLAGGRWARQSYYDSIFAVAKNILIDAEPYMALKGHIQRVRHHGKDDPISIPKEVELKQLAQSNFIEDASKVAEIQTSKLMKATVYAKERISMADKAGQAALEYLMKRKHWLHATKNSDVCQHAMRLYR